MTRKTIVSIVSISLLTVLVLSGCGLASQNISGRGVVELQGGSLGGEDLTLPAEATFSLNFACYAQNNNRVEGYLNWNDPKNGVTLKATMPETPVKVLTNGQYTTCKQLKAAGAGVGFTAYVAGTWNENGNADGDSGTQTGVVGIIVAQPGASLPPLDPLPLPDEFSCGETGTAVFIGAESQSIPDYFAVGCLDRGKITFGATQNQNQQ